MKNFSEAMKLAFPKKLSDAEREAREFLERMSKPRVRYKLRRRYHWDEDKHEFIGVYQ